MSVYTSSVEKALKTLRSLGEDHQRQRAVPNLAEQIWDCADALDVAHRALVEERDIHQEAREALEEAVTVLRAERNKAEARVRELEAERDDLVSRIPTGNGDSGQELMVVHSGSVHGLMLNGYGRRCWEAGLNAAVTEAAQPDAGRLRALVKEASEIMQITYAGNFPAGIESFLVRAATALASPAQEPKE